LSGACAAGLFTRTACAAQSGMAGAIRQSRPG